MCSRHSLLAATHEETGLKEGWHDPIGPMLSTLAPGAMTNVGLVSRAVLWIAPATSLHGAQAPPCLCAAPATRAAPPILLRPPPHWGSLGAGRGGAGQVSPGSGPPRPLCLGPPAPRRALRVGVHFPLPSSSRPHSPNTPVEMQGNAWDGGERGWGHHHSAPHFLPASSRGPPPFRRLVTLTTERSRCSSSRSRLLR